MAKNFSKWNKSVTQDSKTPSARAVRRRGHKIAKHGENQTKQTVREIMKRG